jgi:hypothetical protein
MNLNQTIAEAVTTAFEQLADLTVPAVIKRVDGRGFDPVAGAPEVEQGTEIDGDAIRDKFSIHVIDGERIRADDVKVLFRVSAADQVAGSVIAPAFNPAAGDELIMGGVTYRVIDALPIQPGDTIFLYELQVRA